MHTYKNALSYNNILIVEIITSTFNITMYSQNNYFKVIKSILS